MSQHDTRMYCKSRTNHAALLPLCCISALCRRGRTCKRLQMLTCAANQACDAAPPPTLIRCHRIASHPSRPFIAHPPGRLGHALVIFSMPLPVTVHTISIPTSATPRQPRAQQKRSLVRCAVACLVYYYLTLPVLPATDRDHPTLPYPPSHSLPIPAILLLSSPLPPVLI